MTIPQGTIEAADAAYQSAILYDIHRSLNERSRFAIQRALEAAAEYDRAHPPEVTDAMALTALQSWTSAPEANNLGELIENMRRAIEAALREMLK